MKFKSVFKYMDEAEYSMVKIFKGNVRVEGGWVKTEDAEAFAQYAKQQHLNYYPKAKLEVVIHHHGMQRGGVGSILEHVKIN